MYASDLVVDLIPWRRKYSRWHYEIAETKEYKYLGIGFPRAWMLEEVAINPGA